MKDRGVRQAVRHLRLRSLNWKAPAARRALPAMSCVWCSSQPQLSTRAWTPMSLAPKRWGDGAVDDHERACRGHSHCVDF
jgi:hypothetical protein